MEDKICKLVTKSLAFKESGETLSVTINIENVSPNASNDFIISLINILFEEAKKVIT